MILDADKIERMIHVTIRNQLLWAAQHPGRDTLHPDDVAPYRRALLAHSAISYILPSWGQLQIGHVSIGDTLIVGVELGHYLLAPATTPQAC